MTEENLTPNRFIKRLNIRMGADYKVKTLYGWLDTGKVVHTFYKINGRITIPASEIDRIATEGIIKVFGKAEL